MTITVVDIPFEEHLLARGSGVKYDSKLKVSYIEGPVPAKLDAYRSKDFSYARWVEDTVNKGIRPFTPGPVEFVPREHQKTASDDIVRAYREGWPGYLLADATGTGKTLSMIGGAYGIARASRHTENRPLKLLVVCPKSAIPGWRQSLCAYAGTPFLRPLIINYQQLNKLIKEPAQAKRARTVRTRNRQTARNGTPRISFDVVIYDEAHNLKNWGSSAASLAAATIARLNDDYVPGKTPFVIYGTATPGSSPLNLAIMAPWLAKALDPRIRRHVSPNEWGRFLLDHGFHVSHGKSGWNWVSMPWFGAKSTDPKEKRKYELAKRKAVEAQNEDTKRIGDALLGHGVPFLMRKPQDIAGWPEQQVEPLLIELSPADHAAYEEAWSRFRDYLRLKGRQKDPTTALTQQLRFRQKSSLLKAKWVGEYAADLVDEGKQVYIGCEFTETMDEIAKALDGRRVRHVEYSGRNVTERDEERIRFQKGEAKVILSTVTAAVSFHANETLPDGTKATSSPRVTIIADIRQNPLDCAQQMGRAHRDGQSSLALFPIIVGTVDEKVVNTFIMKIRNMKTMMAENDPDFLMRTFEAVAG